MSDGLIAATQPFFIVPSRDFSSSATSSGGTAANAVDNSLATSCDLGAATWTLTIDTGASKTYNGIRIYWDATSGKINYRVDESSTGAFAGEETEVVKSTFANVDATTLDVFNATTRYLRITAEGLASGSGNAIIKEAEVFSAGCH